MKCTIQWIQSKDDQNPTWNVYTNAHQNVSNRTLTESPGLNEPKSCELPIAKITNASTSINMVEIVSGIEASACGGGIKVVTKQVER